MQIHMHCIVLLLAAIIAVANSSDYYELLGVSRDATTRELRKAFKKLALSKHPDKNPDNPKAHDEFVAINTAFEALKDPETRRIYDRFGEEGLKEKDQHGDNYQSYQYYQEEFGLYDNDEQIVTLTGWDFDHVVQSNAAVFVNFYSPGCSHCHDLAPAWRELGKAVGDFMTIAAVNCQDSWHLCRQMNIQSYPSLLIFKSGQSRPYRGARNIDSLTSFALNQLPNARVMPKMAWDPVAQSESPEETWNWPNIAQSHWAELATPYAAVVVCAAQDGCLDDVDARKLQAIVGDVATIWMVKCKQRPTFCSEHAVTGSLVGLYTSWDTVVDLFPFALDGDHADYSEQDDTLAQWYSPSIVTDIQQQLFASLPQPDELDGSRLASIANGDDLSIHAVLFLHLEAAQLQDEARDALARRLHSVPDGLTVWTYTCDNDCMAAHSIAKLPTLRMYRPDGFETYAHPHYDPNTLLEWLQQGFNSRVQALNPSDFPSPIMTDEGVTLVDFFAGWCQPCQNMLPHYRTASTHATLHNITVGSVDCSDQPRLCQDLNIHSYPTVILYPGNNKDPIMYQGDIFDSDGFVRFVSLSLNPAVHVMTEASFAAAINDVTTPWMFDFYAPWCGPCMQFKPAFEQAAHELRNIVQLGLIDCTQLTNLCHREGIRSYPTIRLCLPAKPGSKRRCLPYRGQRYTEALVAAAMQSLPSKVTELSAISFDKRRAASSERPLVVSFGTDWCGPCREYKPRFKQAAYMLTSTASTVDLAHIDCQRHEALCHSLDIPHYPYILLFIKPAGAPIILDPADPAQLVETINRALAEKLNESRHDEL